MRRMVCLVPVLGLVVMCAVGCSAAAATPHEADSKTILITSGPTWRTSHGGRFIGMAQNVCLTPSVPANCPAGAVNYGYGGGGWTADLSAIPGATWIWAPRINGRSPNASLSSYRFSRRITIHSHVLNATLYIASDDLVRIKVNGKKVGRWGTVTNREKAGRAGARLKSFDVTALLTQGVNRMSVWAENGPDSFAGCSPCTYQQNPAGVVFGWSITVAQ